MKRLKNVESKNEQQLVAIKDQEEKQLEAIRDHGEIQLSTIESYGATNSLHKIEFEIEFEIEIEFDEVNRMSIETKYKYKKSLFLHSNGKDTYDSNDFKDIKQLNNNIFNGRISIKQAKAEQNEMKKEMAG